MPDTNSNSLEALLGQISMGRRTAFEALYEATASRLFGICLRVLGHPADAEDALQDVYTVVWRKAAQFDPAKASANAWLAMIARNKALDRLRSMPAQASRASLTLTEEMEDPGDTLPQQVQMAADRAKLHFCLERLEPRRRSLIRAAFFEGLTYEELATKIEAPLGSVKSWIRRGLMQLRDCLDP